MKYSLLFLTVLSFSLPLMAGVGPAKQCRSTSLGQSKQTSCDAESIEELKKGLY